MYIKDVFLGLKAPANPLSPHFVDVLEDHLLQLDHVDQFFVTLHTHPHVRLHNTVATSSTRFRALLSVQND